jgi:NADH:ubiquinone oxidoreductase subunit F (NADH-binding)
LLNFFRHESCGKCTPCRVGSKRAYQILTAISKGAGTQQDLDDLQMLSNNLTEFSHCGLGQTAAVPIRDIFRHFRAEVDAHVRLGVCPAGACPMHEQLRPDTISAEDRL